MLITNIRGKSALECVLSSTSASKFEIPIDARINSYASIGILNFEADALESTFAYDIRDQHIRIDKNGQVRFESAGGEFDRFTCK